MFRNALIERYRRSSLRPRSFGTLLFVYFAIVLLIVIVNLALWREDRLYGSLQDVGGGAFTCFLTMEILLLGCWAAANTSSAIREEVMERSHDFFRMIPLSAMEKAVGILVGRNLVTLLFSAITLVFMLLSGWVGGLELLWLAKCLFALLAVAALINALALLSSIDPSAKQRHSGGPLGAVLAGFVAIPFVLSVAKDGGLDEQQVGLLNGEVSVLVLVGILALYFAAWAFLGVLRLFEHEHQPVMTRGGALLFLLGYECWAAALYMPHAGSKAFGFFTLAASLPLLAMPFGAQRTYDQYLEMGAWAPDEVATAPRRFLVRTSNLTTSLALGVLWAGFVAGAGFMTGVNAADVLMIVGTLVSFYAVFVVLMELSVVFGPLNPKTNALIGFLMALWVFLPIIFGPLLDLGTLPRFSLLGYFASLTVDGPTGPASDSLAWATNLLLIVIPAWLIRRRYRELVATRARM